MTAISLDRNWINKWFGIYIFSKGENGEQCIKLAICETTQIERMSDKHKSNEPDSFVKELLRVVFR